MQPCHVLLIASKTLNNALSVSGTSIITPGAAAPQTFLTGLRWAGMMLCTSFFCRTPDVVTITAPAFQVGSIPGAILCTVLM